jgi:hypothetical protein
VQREVGDLEVGGLLGELFDGVSPVLEDPLVAVDVGDARDAGGRVEVRRVVRHQAEVLRVDLDLPEVHGPDRLVLHGNDVLLAGSVVPNGQAVLAHAFPFLRAGLDWAF